jgi:hypothetical protein
MGEPKQRTRVGLPVVFVRGVPTPAVLVRLVSELHPGQQVGRARREFVDERPEDVMGALAGRLVLHHSRSPEDSGVRAAFSVPGAGRAARGMLPDQPQQRPPRFEAADVTDTNRGCGVDLPDANAFDDRQQQSPGSGAITTFGTDHIRSATSDR